MLGIAVYAFYHGFSDDSVQLKPRDGTWVPMKGGVHSDVIDVRDIYDRFSIHSKCSLDTPLKTGPPWLEGPFFFCRWFPGLTFLSHEVF
jgi:hypothetical protein